VGHDGQGGQRSRAAYGIPVGHEFDPASAPPVAQPHGLGLWQRPHNPLVAASLGHSGCGGSSKLSNFGHPHGWGLLQRLHLPPSNFSITLPLRDRPTKYPTIKRSANPNKSIIGVTFNAEAILFSIRVFYAGQV